MLENNPGDISEIVLPKLKRFAKGWKENFSDILITRIVLYRYRHSISDRILQRKDPARRVVLYVVVFEISGLNLEIYRERYRSVGKIGSSTKHILNNWSIDVTEAIRWGSFMGEMRHSPPLPPLLPLRNFLEKIDNFGSRNPSESFFIFPGFEQVHKGILPTDLLKMTDEKREKSLKQLYRNWFFIAVPPEGPLPEYVDDSHLWVLWEDENQKVESVELVKNKPNLDTFPKDVIDHVTCIKPLVIKIYNSLKLGPGWNRGDKPDDKKARMEDALNFYDDNRTTLSDLNRNALEDPNIYNKSYSNNKRDIVGRIIQQDVKLKGLGKHSYRRLFLICQNTPTKSTN